MVLTKFFDAVVILVPFYQKCVTPTFPPSFAQGASQSIESSHEAFEAMEDENKNYYSKRSERINSIYLRSKINQYAFQFSNPLTVFFRDIGLKYLSKNEKFLESYLGKIYKN